MNLETIEPKESTPKQVAYMAYDCERNKHNPGAFGTIMACYIPALFAHIAYQNAEIERLKGETKTP